MRLLPSTVLAKGVEINQVGVRRGHRPDSYSAADGQRLQPPRARHRAAREHGADLHGAWHGRTRWLKVLADRAAL